MRSELKIQTRKLTRGKGDDPSTKKETFTGEQIGVILAWRLLIARCDPLCLRDGARLGDVAKLRWSNLDVANGIVVFKEQKTATRA